MTTEQPDTLRDALATALSVALHDHLDPDCTGTPDYFVTQRMAEQVMQTPVVRAVLGDNLTVAWNRVEAALPDGGVITGLAPWAPGWGAGASVETNGSRTTFYEYGDTPAAALDALAEQLEARTGSPDPTMTEDDAYRGLTPDGEFR